MTNKTEFPEGEKFKLDEAIKALNILVRASFEFNNAGFVTENFITPALKSGYNLDAIHEELSKYGIFLVAVPLEKFGYSYGLFLPIENQKSLTHALWVCMKGKNEYLQELKKLNIENDQNLELLKSNTGFLCEK